MTKEIGGYIEFEHYHGEMFHEQAIKLNSGRNCLVYLIRAKGIKKIIIPYYLCDCIEDVCRKENVETRYYHVRLDFLPEDIELTDDEWLYIVNYYGQLSKKQIIEYKHKYDRVILDNAHAYFEEPICGVDTLYTCRKFFGVPDGGILYTDAKTEVKEIDESYKRLSFLAGRFERTGREFYDFSQENEKRFYNEPLKLMSVLTENILRSLDYNRITQQRNENWQYLDEFLKHNNKLKLTIPYGAFMYPLMTDDAASIRKKMIEDKIYIPHLWPGRFSSIWGTDTEQRLADDILPLPCDQRYTVSDMSIIIKAIQKYC